MAGSSDPTRATFASDLERVRSGLAFDTYLARQEAWAGHDIELPPYDETWREWLSRAVDTANDVDEADPNHWLETLVVPPAAEFLAHTDELTGGTIRDWSSEESLGCDGWRMLLADMRPSVASTRVSTVRGYLDTYAELAGYRTKLH